MMSTPTASIELETEGLLEKPPLSILIVGSGVFGLSMAWGLSQHQAFARTAVTVVDAGAGGLPAPDAASMDSSRIIRTDYADAPYAALASLAQGEWRKQGDDDLGGGGRYSQSGLLLLADGPSKEQAGGRSGMEYLMQSWKNACACASRDKLPVDKIQLLESREALQACLGADTSPAQRGYLNALSGWADAAKAMQWLRRQVEATGRVDFVEAQVQELVTEGERVVGARLGQGHVLEGEMVIVAAGAWTGDLIDLRGQVEATGHPVAYVDITAEEALLLKTQPAVLDLSSGLYVLPPSGLVLKVGRHDFGYLNPDTVTTALPPSASLERQPIVVSRPATSRHRRHLARRLPAEAERDLRRALARLVPVPGLDKRPWGETRICWYSDTCDGDWLVDWHPGWKGLFVATGDSGHGFKFLPTLGAKLVDSLTGDGGELGRKWRWRAQGAGESQGRGADSYHGLTTTDGSRSGRAGIVWREELLRGAGLMEDSLADV